MEQTQGRLSKELDIVKLIRNIRNNKILLKNSIMSPEVKFQLAHTGKNYIDLDHISCSDSNSCSDDQSED